MDCGPPGSSVPGILQARTLEGVAIVFSRESSGPKDRTRVSWVSCTGMRVPSHQHHLVCCSSQGHKGLDVTLQLNSGNIFLSGEHTQAAVQISSRTSLCTCAGFPHSSAGKESACNSGDPGSIPGWGRSTGEGIGYPLQSCWASLVAQLVKNLPAMGETWVWSRGWEDPLEKGKATHSSILAWRIPCTV